MKKTLIALLALSSVAMADTSELIYTTHSADANRSGGIGGVAFQLTDNDRMDLTEGTVTSSITDVELKSITLQISNTTAPGGWNANLAMYILDQDKHLIAVSEVLGGTDFTTSSYQTFTFNDTASLVVREGKDNQNQALTLGTQYYAYITDKGVFSNTNKAIGLIGMGDVLSWIDTTAVNLSLYNYNETASDAVLANAVMVDGSVQQHTLKYNGQYGAVMSITTEVDVPKPDPVVPEPTTGTLSLLALAGLMARRRRK